MFSMTYGAQKVAFGRVPPAQLWSDPQASANKRGYVGQRPAAI